MSVLHFSQSIIVPGVYSRLVGADTIFLRCVVAGFLAQMSSLDGGAEPEFLPHLREL